MAVCADLIHSVVMRGLDPRTHHLCEEKMDPRVTAEEGGDNKTCLQRYLMREDYNVEVENRGGSRLSLRGGRSHLGLCAAGPGARVLRVARLHGAAREARCAGGAFAEPGGADLPAAWSV